MDAPPLPRSVRLDPRREQDQAEANRRLIGVVVADFDRAWNLLRAERCDFTRRTFIRTTFAAIEAMVWELKQSIVIDVQAGRTECTHAELAMLRETGYALDRSGRVQGEKLRLPFMSNLKFALKTYAKRYRQTELLDFGGPGFQALDRSRQVRDRLTHPKSDEQLAVTDREVEDAYEAFQWFFQTTNGILKAEVARLEALHKQLKRETAAAQANKTTSTPPSP